MTLHFKEFDNETIYCLAGSQSTPYFGFGGILVKIEGFMGSELIYSVSENIIWNGDRNKVPQDLLPNDYKEAIYLGAKYCYKFNKIKYGIKFSVIDVTWHVMDSNIRIFKIAGAGALYKWLEKSDNFSNLSFPPDSFLTSNRLTRSRKTQAFKKKDT